MVSTKLMGTVTSVLVHEGDVVRSGQVLVQIDARDLNAKASQVAAAIADAEAMQREASTHAARFTALYNDSAATKAQYDAAQTGLARANAGLQAARAGASELEAVRSYAAVRAPFAGIVTMRHAQPSQDYSYYLTIQKAFYERGENITREDVLAGYASLFGVPVERFQELFHSEAIKQAVLNDFGVAKQFGIEGFPTLILHRTDAQNPNALLLVGQGYAPAQDMIQHIEAGLTADL
jgi:multidrug efflux pump subunit AcrA (membrane-fusion protein)